jgi:hypothetical protein
VAAAPAAAVDSVLPPDGAAALGASLAPGSRDAALLEVPPPPQAVRVTARAARSDTPRTDVFIVVLPLAGDEPPARPARELRCVEESKVASVERVPPAGKGIWSVNDLRDTTGPVGKRAERA